MLWRRYSGARTPHSHHRHPNRPSRPLTVNPTPPLPTWKPQKVLPRSGNVVGWRLALPTTLPGHGSGFLCLPRRRYARTLCPYAAALAPSSQRHTKCRNTPRCKNHGCGSCPLQPPINMGTSKSNQMQPNAPFAARITPATSKTTPASPGSASALPGDIGDDWARICARFQRRQPLGSPLRLPEKFQGAGGTRSTGTRGGARTTPVLMPFKAPRRSGASWNRHRGSQSPPAIKDPQKNMETTPASPGSASALPGNIAGDRVRICTRFQ